MIDRDQAQRHLAEVDVGVADGRADGDGLFADFDDLHGGLLDAVDAACDDRRRRAFAANARFLCFDAATTPPMNFILAGGLPGAGRQRQFLARRRGPPHDAARVQPPHPRAGGMARRRAVRPQHAARAADARRANGSGRMAEELLARVARVPRRGARGGRGQLGHAALRRHARPVLHLPAALAARRWRRSTTRRAGRSWCPTCCSAARRCCAEPGAVRASRMHRRRARGELDAAGVALHRGRHRHAAARARAGRAGGAPARVQRRVRAGAHRAPGAGPRTLATTTVFTASARVRAQDAWRWKAVGSRGCRSRWCATSLRHASCRSPGRCTGAGRWRSGCIGIRRG